MKVGEGVHRRGNDGTQRNWWLEPKGNVHSAAMNYVMAVDRVQATIFDKFVKLESLYDNSPRTNLWADRSATQALGVVVENVVASNVDTVTAAIAATDVRARFMTDDADWSQQRIARQLEYYADALGKLLGVGEKCRHAFKSAAIKGTGLVKVYVDEFDQIRIDPVLVDDIVVDEQESRSGQPRQLHYRTMLDRDDLKAQFPEFEVEIENAQISPGRNWRLWAGYRPINRNELVVIESWILPIGVKGAKGYKPGRHTITIDGCDLLDEEWHKAFFPFARIVWAKPIRGWYGISLAERIAGIQLSLNKRNWQIERTLDQAAAPTTYVNIIDANLAVKTTNRIGNIAVVKGATPVTPNPPQVPGEVYQSRTDLKASAYEESGVSRLAAQAVKPSGIDSAVAMREYRDQTTQRFSIQEKAFEQFWLDVIWLLLDCCKDLGAKAPVVNKRTRFGAKKIAWSQVDMGDVKVQIVAASTLSQTPAGRAQTVVEWAQAGIISTDEARALTEHPDLESALSVYTEAIENVRRCIEEIEDGETLTPEPYQNLQAIVHYGQMAYLKDGDLGAPEAVLEGLRQWIVQAAYMLNPPPAASPSMPGIMPGAPANANVPPGIGAPMPQAAPTAAFAPQAMQTLAS